MPRLFVAIDFPPAVKAQLESIRPGPSPGMRLVSAEQTHLTLHFIGEAEIADVAEALSTVRVEPFEFEIKGVGCFSSSRGPAVLWAGVSKNEQLLDLHRQTGSALAGIGLKTEVRDYEPHVTIGRCSRKIHRAAISDFLSRHRDLSISGILFREFVLYSSKFSGEIHVHHRERVFASCDVSTVI